MSQVCFSACLYGSPTAVDLRGTGVCGEHHAVVWIAGRKCLKRAPARSNLCAGHGLKWGVGHALNGQSPLVNYICTPASRVPSQAPAPTSRLTMPTPSFAVSKPCLRPARGRGARMVQCAPRYRSTLSRPHACTACRHCSGATCCGMHPRTTPRTTCMCSPVATSTASLRF